MKAVRSGQGPLTPHHVPCWQGLSSGTASARPRLHAAVPNRKWVTDFTYCRTWSDFVRVGFVIDCFSRAIVGWHATTVKDTAMVTMALKMALWRRDHADHRVGAGLIHHSDAGSPNTHPSRSPKPLSWRGLRHRSVSSATPTMRWRRRRLGCSRPKRLVVVARS